MSAAGSPGTGVVLSLSGFAMTRFDYDKCNETELYERYRNKGDEVAFETLVKRLTPILMAYIGSMIGIRSPDADDVYQRVWLKAADHKVRWEGGRFRPWIMCIAHNTVVDVIRERKYETSFGDTSELDIASEPLHGLHPHIPAPDIAYAGLDLSEFITGCVMRLPHDLREVFVMRIFDEMSFKDIAGAIGIPLNTALGRMHYAVGRLRSELNAYREQLSH